MEGVGGNTDMAYNMAYYVGDSMNTLKHRTGRWTAGEVIMLACGVIMVFCAVGLLLIALVVRP